MIRLGSLCTGHGGLDLAAEQVLGPVEHVWHAELDPNASKVLAHHWPETPNLGDLTLVDWDTVDQVDILTAGYPCQPVSLAGRRRGTDDNRWIWDDIANAVRVLRPRLVLLENVTGHRSLGFGRVLADLATSGFDAEWGCYRASDVGAPHRRDRVFVLAWPSGLPPQFDGRGGVTADGPGGLTLLPTPDATHGRKTSRTGPLLAGAVELLPTPTVTDARGGRNVTANRAAVKPTTNAAGWTLSDVAHANRWGNYSPAVRRWEQVTGREAPDPTVPGMRGQLQLSPRFVEWMMGLDDGWVTDHLTHRTVALKCLGNGVVPRQAVYAYAELLTAAGGPQDSTIHGRQEKTGE